MFSLRMSSRWPLGEFDVRGPGLHFFSGVNLGLQRLHFCRERSFKLGLRHFVGALNRLVRKRATFHLMRGGVFGAMGQSFSQTINIDSRQGSCPIAIGIVAPGKTGGVRLQIAPKLWTVIAVPVVLETCLRIEIMSGESQRHVNGACRVNLGRSVGADLCRPNSSPGMIIDANWSRNLVREDVNNIFRTRAPRRASRIL